MLRETSVAETAARHAMEDARTAEDAVPTPSQLAPSESSSSDDPVRYLAFLLDDVSRCLLLDWTRDLGGEDGGEHARGWIVHADHCTIAHSPTEAQLATFPWGLECEIRVLGVAGDARARAVHVELPDFIPQPASGVTPHVTIGCAPSVRPVVAGEVLEEAMVSGAFLGAFYTLVPIRPRSRGERRSLRTLPGASLRPPLAFNPRHRRLSTSTDAFKLHPDIRLYRDVDGGAADAARTVRGGHDGR
jgi:hypothetical protein